MKQNTTVPFSMMEKDLVPIIDRGYEPITETVNYDPQKQISNTINMGGKETWSSVTSTGTGIIGTSDDDPDQGKDD